MTDRDDITASFLAPVDEAFPNETGVTALGVDGQIRARGVNAEAITAFR